MCRSSQRGWWKTRLEPCKTLNYSITGLCKDRDTFDVFLACKQIPQSETQTSCYFDKDFMTLKDSSIRSLLFSVDDENGMDIKSFCGWARSDGWSFYTAVSSSSDHPTHGT